MGKKNLSEKIYLSITGRGNAAWKSKLEEINELGIKKAAVFLTQFEPKEREGLYQSLLKSSIEEVPLVHVRDDVDKSEIEFFIKNFKTEHFNMHEGHFGILDKWKDYHDKLYLELNYTNSVTDEVEVEKIAGFCVDLGHYKVAVARGSDEAYYIFSKKNKTKFACNHLGGYSEKDTIDIHHISDLREFDYLKTLPDYIWGDIIALEVENSIKEQIEFKKYIINLFK